MKTSIKKIKESYVINEEKGVVVCIIMGYTDILDVRESFKVTGVSKCRPEDKFDVNVGKRLAESKAKISMFKLSRLRNKKAAEELLKIANTLDDVVASNEHCLVVEIKHLGELRNEVL